MERSWAECARQNNAADAAGRGACYAVPDVIPPRADAAIDLRRDHDISPRDVKGFQ
jgi:hypothetical protein